LQKFFHSKEFIVLFNVDFKYENLLAIFMESGLVKVGFFSVLPASSISLRIFSEHILFNLAVCIIEVKTL